MKNTNSQNTVYREICCLLRPVFPFLHWSLERPIQKNLGRSQSTAISKNEKQIKAEENKNGKLFSSNSRKAALLSVHHFVNNKSQGGYLT